MGKSLKKITVVTSVLLMVFMSFFCFGSYAYGDTQHMVDYSGYLYDSEVSEINDYLSAVSEEMEFDIVGVMINEGYDENSLRSFADDFYDYGGYGYGTEKDGAVFVVDMESRLMTLVTTGFGITAITDYGEELVYDYVTDELQSENFVGAYEGYADAVRELVYKAREGTPVDVDDGGQDDGQGEYERRLPSAEAAAGMGGISLAAGAGAGFLSSQRQKSKLKTVRRKTQANSYARRDSLVLSRKQDRFLYRTVAVMPRPKNNNNNRPHGMGGGGTTIHMGSSGTPHGGGHARGF